MDSPEPMASRRPVAAAVEPPLAIDRAQLSAILSEVATAREKLICLHLAMTESTTPSRITEELGLPLTAVLPLLSRLQDRGLVERSPDGIRLAEDLELGSAE